MRQRLSGPRGDRRDVGNARDQRSEHFRRANCRDGRRYCERSGRRAVVKAAIAGPTNAALSRRQGACRLCPEAHVAAGHDSPLFASIGGVGAGLGTAQGRLAQGAVTGQEGPVDADRLVVVQKPAAPDLVEDPRLLPLLRNVDGRCLNCRSRRRKGRSTACRCATPAGWCPSRDGRGCADGDSPGDGPAGGGNRGSIFCHSQSGMRRPSSRSMSRICDLLVSGQWARSPGDSRRLSQVRQG